MDGYEQAKAFHHVFNPVTTKSPHSLDVKDMSSRIDFKLEELVELVAATAQGNQQIFDELIIKMHQDIDKAVLKNKKKLIEKGNEENLLAQQVDALLDLLYFTYGSFVLMGVDPRPLQKIVHEANMGKLFPDGKPHYDKITGKVLKPDNWEKDYAPEPKIREELRNQKKKQGEREFV